MIISPSYETVLTGEILQSKDVLALVPQSPEEVAQRAEQAIIRAKAEMTSWQAILGADRTIANTLRAFDAISANFDNARNTLSACETFHTDEKVVAAINEQVDLMHRATPAIFKTQEVYVAFEAISGQLCSKEEQRFLDQMLMQGRSGQADSPGKQARVDEIDKYGAGLRPLFMKHNQENNPGILLADEEMPRVKQEKKDELVREGNFYRIPVKESNLEDKDLTVGAREKRMRLFCNYLYEFNAPVFDQILPQRLEQANLLGFNNYADFRLAKTTFKTVENFNNFIRPIRASCQEVGAKKAAELIAFARKNGMADCLAGDKLRYDSIGVIKDAFTKSKQGDVLDKSSDFFALKPTLDKVCHLYEQFTDLTIEIMPQPEVCEGVYRWLLCISKDGKRLGTVILHAFLPEKARWRVGVTWPMISPARGKNKVCAVQIFYRRMSGDVPCCSWRNVTTMFHELGHALSFMGDNTLQVFSGFGLITPASGVQQTEDYGEFEGDVLETLICDPGVMTELSGHYQTSEPLSAEQVACLNHGGTFAHQSLQWFCADLSVRMYSGPQSYKELHKLYYDLVHEYDPMVAVPGDLHRVTHMHWLVAPNYGPLMYKYAWAWFLAYGVIGELRKQGLSVHEMGRRILKDGVLRGGGLPPKEMLSGILGKPFVYQDLIEPYIDALRAS